MIYELYKFTDEYGGKWLFTDSSTVKVYDMESYTPATITRGVSSEAVEKEKQSLTIKTTILNDFVISFLERFNSSQISFSLFRSDGEKTSLIYAGKVGSLEIDSNEATIIIQSLMIDLQRKTGKYPVQTSCTNVLFDDYCGLFKAHYSADGTVTASTPTSLTSPTFELKPSGYYTGGIVEMQGVFLQVLSHTGDTITTLTSSKKSFTGRQFKVYAGCNRTATTCAEKFNNIENFRGFPALPAKNPFSGDSII